MLNALVGFEGYEITEIRSVGLYAAKKTTLQANSLLPPLTIRRDPTGPLKSIG